MIDAMPMMTSVFTKCIMITQCMQRGNYIYHFQMMVIPGFIQTQLTNPNSLF